MNGIFPNFTGSTGEPCLSLYPDWLGDSFFDVTITRSSGGTYGINKRKQVEKDPLLAQQLREDEELLATVMVAMRVLQ